MDVLRAVIEGWRPSWLLSLPVAVIRGWLEAPRMISLSVAVTGGELETSLTIYLLTGC